MPVNRESVLVVEEGPALSAFTIMLLNLNILNGFPFNPILGAM